MNRSGYTVSPVVSETGEYLGSEVDGMHSGYQSADDDYYETVDGLKHHFQEVELNENQEDEYSSTGFFENVLEAYPGLTDALDWANDSGHWNPDQFDVLAEAIQADDHDTMMPMLESLAEDFYEIQPQVNLTQQRYEETDETEEPSEGFDDSQVAALKNVVPGGESTYQSTLEWAAQYWPEDEISAYDEIMESGNFEYCQEAIEALYVAWYEDNY